MTASRTKARRHAEARAWGRVVDSNLACSLVHALGARDESAAQAARRGAACCCVCVASEGDAGSACATTGLMDSQGPWLLRDRLVTEDRGRTRSDRRRPRAPMPLLPWAPALCGLADAPGTSQRAQPAAPSPWTVGGRWGAGLRASTRGRTPGRWRRPKTAPPGPAPAAAPTRVLPNRWPLLANAASTRTLTALGRPGPGASARWQRRCDTRPQGVLAAALGTKERQSGRERELLAHPKNTLSRQGRCWPCLREAAVPQAAA